MAENDFIEKSKIGIEWDMKLGFVFATLIDVFLGNEDACAIRRLQRIYSLINDKVKFLYTHYEWTRAGALMLHVQPIASVQKPSWHFDRKPNDISPCFCC